jgi:hypothetical protein
MPLSNFFKKSPKQELDILSTRDGSFLSPEMQKKRCSAAMEFLRVFKEKIPLVHGRPHAGTVLSVVARLAGSSLYHSLNYKHDIDPGSVVLSREDNEAWPPLMNLFAFYCKQNGLDVMSKPLVTKVPEQDQPRMEVEQVLAEYQAQYRKIMKKHGLDDLDGARAGMIVCSILFEYHCKTAKDIDPFVATGIVAKGIVEGAKTAPPREPERSKPIANSESRAQSDPSQQLLTSIAQNSTDGAGDRLVIGEGMTAMGEALRHGGRYILVHPQVLNQLKANHVDAFLIYEAAMRMETASKIPQIDFVGANVDELLREWREKPESQVPIHVRQVLWLMNNAQSLGYERKGDRWTLN